MHGYAKSDTIPVPAKPVTSNLWVFPYPCQTLTLVGVDAVVGLLRAEGVVMGCGYVRSWLVRLPTEKDCAKGAYLAPSQ